MGRRTPGPGANRVFGWGLGIALVATLSAVAAVSFGGGDSRVERPRSVGGGETPVERRQPVVGQLWIDPTGGTCSRSAAPIAHRDAAACPTFEAAYRAARQGDTVLVKGGTYIDAELGGVAKGDPDEDEPDVRFLAAPDEPVRMHDVEVTVPHITFEDIDLLEAAFKYRSDVDGQLAGDITVINSDGHSMTVASVWNFTLLASDLGPQTHPGQPRDDTQDALFVGAYPVDDGHHPKHVRIEDVTFHDVVRPFPEAHSDCLQFTAGEDVVVRRSRFYNCADAAIIPKNDQGPIRDLVIENSVINETVNGSEEINFFDTGRPCGAISFRNNSVIGTIRIDGGEPGTDCDLAVVGNITSSLSETRCATSQAGVLEHNIWETGVPCGATNLVTPDGDAGFVNRANDASMDLRLIDRSEAVDRGHPTDHPAVDHDGVRRPVGAAPDAGAHEIG